MVMMMLELGVRRADRTNGSHVVKREEQLWVELSELSHTFAIVVAQ
jgi:hypothetical protein